MSAPAPAAKWGTVIGVAVVRPQDVAALRLVAATPPAEGSFAAKSCVVIVLRNGMCLRTEVASLDEARELLAAREE